VLTAALSIQQYVILVQAGTVDGRRDGKRRLPSTFWLLAPARQTTPRRRQSDIELHISRSRTGDCEEEARISRFHKSPSSASGKKILSAAGFLQIVSSLYHAVRYRIFDATLYHLRELWTWTRRRY
jgi:hypothetical protein